MNQRFKAMKHFVVGFLACACITGSVAYASGEASIQVVFKSIRYMFDGVEKAPSDGKSILYEGTTYVPLRFISESIGKEVEWDSETETIWVGKREGQFKYLNEIEYAKYDGIGFWDFSFNARSLRIAGDKYLHGISATLGENAKQKGSVSYNLNGAYNRLTGYLGVDDFTKNSKNSGTVIILGDGKELYRKSGVAGSDNPIFFEINVSGISKLQVEFQSVEGQTEAL